MFDPGLLLALDQIPSSIPQKPVLPIEQVMQSPAAAFADEHVKQVMSAARKQHERWRESMDTLLSRLNASQPTDWIMAAQALLDQTIYRVDRMAQELARAASREEKRGERLNRQLDPFLARSHRNAIKQTVAFDQERVEALLEFALQLRALRSKLAPDAGKGPVFDSAADLDKFLSDATHA